MCTVSFYSDISKVIITSNRDENINRPLAIAPKSYVYNGKTLFFPQDPQAGGTWFVVNDYGDVFVLLNGAESKHIANPPYRKSRGIILLDLASSTQFDSAWTDIELMDIEPFTIVAFVNRVLLQIRWNGESKTYQILDKEVPHIWSSTTLYEQRIIKERKYWFMNFLNLKKKDINAGDLIDFHTNTQSDDVLNGLIINRNKMMLTKNITQCVITKHHFSLSHLDLIVNKNTKIIEPIK